MKQDDKNIKEYEDIIDLPYQKSIKRKHMSIGDRSAQFAPFAAVVGHDEAVKEIGRYTDRRRELDEMQKAIIDVKLQEIVSKLPEVSEIDVIYFQKDERKSGGTYLNKVGFVKKIDEYEKKLFFTDGDEIDIEDIYNIE